MGGRTEEGKAAGREATEGINACVQAKSNDVLKKGKTIGMERRVLRRAVLAIG